MEIPDELRKAAKLNFEKIEQSAMFLCMFNRSMLDEVLPILQMGAAVFFDKPILIVVPESQVLQIPKNLRAMATGIEVYKDKDLKGLETAVHKLITDFQKQQ
jgi:hypothetical protein